MEGLTLVALGGLLALDETSLGQFMVSRPLVSATLAGWLLGDPAAGFLVGAILECLYLPKLHVGGIRFPDSAPAGVTAAAVAANASGAGDVVVGIVAGLLIGELGSRFVGLHRGIATRMVPDRGDAVTPLRVARSHILVIALDAVRGVAVTAVGVLLVAPAARWLGAGWPFSAPTTAAFLWVLAAGGLGILWASTNLGRRGSLFLGLGLAVAAWGLM